MRHQVRRYGDGKRHALGPILAYIGKGVGFSEAPRGLLLGHWIKSENQKIDSYRCVVADNTDAGPRDDKVKLARTKRR